MSDYLYVINFRDGRTCPMVWRAVLQSLRHIIGIGFPNGWADRMSDLTVARWSRSQRWTP